MPHRIRSLCKFRGHRPCMQHGTPVVSASCCARDAHCTCPSVLNPMSTFSSCKAAPAQWVRPDLLRHFGRRSCKSHRGPVFGRSNQRGCRSAQHREGSWTTISSVFGGHFELNQLVPRDPQIPHMLRSAQYCLRGARPDLLHLPTSNGELVFLCSLIARLCSGMRVFV